MTAAKTDGSDAISRGYKYKGAFFPASGGRGSLAGGLTNVGMYGLYWSSSPGSAAGGYGLTFYGTGVAPANYIGRLDGYAIRCVVK